MILTSRASIERRRDKATGWRERRRGDRGGASEGLLDESQPTTTLQVRLHDGSRKLVKANHSHTVAQLQAHVAALTPGVSFELRGGFPPKPLTPSADKTLKEAGLLSESIVQSTC